MAVLQGPAMSFEASGKLANSIVFSKWKGRAYVRSLVTPANPRSGGQVGMRAMFKFLTQKWDALSAGDKATWEPRADQTSISPFNAYISYNMDRWRNFTAPSQAFPAATADTGPTLGTLAAVAGVRSVTVTQPITTAADGWGIAFFRALSTGFSSAFDNLIGVGLIAATADVVWVDTPLVADTYYYVVRSITQDGQLGAESSEVNAVVV